MGTSYRIVSVDNTASFATHLGNVRSLRGGKLKLGKDKNATRQIIAAEAKKIQAKTNYEYRSQGVVTFSFTSRFPSHKQ
jgi:hypothetical protein